MWRIDNFFFLQKMFFLVCLVASVAQLALEQHSALMDLFDTVGCLRNSTACPRFNASAPCPSTAGLACAGPNVTVIRLAGLGLTGSMASSIGALSALEELVLSQNAVVGTVPASLSRLSRLRVLHLNRNKLSGTVPLLDGLSLMASLAIEDNSFVGKIPTFRGGTSLTYVNVGANMFDTLPSELFRHTSLPVLHAYQNRLVGAVPSEIALLTKLTHLDFGANSLSSFPDIAGLTHLTGLFLISNLLDAWPTSVAALPSLRALHLGLNATGTLPATTIGRLTSLRDLRVMGQFAGSIPSELGLLRQLGVLIFSSGGVAACNENRMIPSQLGRLSDLATLVLGQQCLQGTLPSQAWGLTKLEALDLSNGNLTGTLPPQIARLSRLTGLNLNSNAFQGTVPSQWGRLPLTYLYLFRNQLSGDVPPLEFVPNVTVLSLSCVLVFNVSEGEKNCFSSCPAAQCRCSSEPCTPVTTTTTTMTNTATTTLVSPVMLPIATMMATSNGTTAPPTDSTSVVVGLSVALAAVVLAAVGAIVFFYRRWKRAIGNHDDGKISDRRSDTSAASSPVEPFPFKCSHCSSAYELERDLDTHVAKRHVLSPAAEPFRIHDPIANVPKSADQPAIGIGYLSSASDFRIVPQTAAYDRLAPDNTLPSPSSYSIGTIARQGHYDNMPMR